MRKNPVRLLLAALLIAPLLALSACSDATEPGNDVTGVYTLQTVNGQPLPIVEEDEYYRDEILSGSMILTGHGTWEAISSWRETDKETGEVDQGTSSDDGTYTVSGNTVAFRYPIRMTPMTASAVR